MNRLIGFLVALATTVVPTGAQGQIIAEDVHGLPIAAVNVVIPIGDRVQISTEWAMPNAYPGGFGSDGDTVLSLMSSDGSTTEAGADGCVAAEAFDPPPGATFSWYPSCFEYTNNTSSAFKVLLARAYWTEVAGSTRIFMRTFDDSSGAFLPWQEVTAGPVTAGGIVVWNFEGAFGAPNSTEYLRTRLLPGYNDALHAILTWNPTNVHINDSVNVGNGPFNRAAIYEGARILNRGLVVGSLDPANRGHIALLRNLDFDPGQDMDGDGLSKALEADLGTCDEPADVLTGGFRCDSRQFCGFSPPNAICTAQMRDTDHDGLPDFVETFGWNADGAPTWDAQLLSLWGANPAHKDAFVEVDSYDKVDGNTSCDGACQRV